MFAFRDGQGVADVSFTDRYGGVSTGSWSALNLGTSNGDDPDNVQKNLRILAEELGVLPERIVRVSQQHGREVCVVDESTPRDGTEADALVTTRTDLALLVRVADCTPVALVDGERGVVGVVHAGRKGMAAGVVDAAVAQMRGLGADSITAWVGPRACGRCYEVPAAMREEIGSIVPEAVSTTSWGTPALDVGAGVAAQLRSAGVEVIDLADLTQGPGACTIEDDRYFSYRRQGALSGRCGALVRLRP